MKKLYYVKHTFSLLFLLTGLYFVSAQNVDGTKARKISKVLYFNPEVFPDIEEIKNPTYNSFFTTLSDFLSTSKNTQLLRVDYNIPFEDPEASLISEFCQNNNAQYAVVPKVKYFKVGFGKYVFSNQVIVSLKIYSVAGELLAESSYDTYRKKGRLLGSAENSIKIGTNGALKSLNKILRKKYRAGYSTINEFEMFPSEKFSLIPN